MNALAAITPWRRLRLPLVLQGERSECALACLAMVAHYHGHRLELPELRRRFGVSQRGATLAQLLDMADRLQLAPRPVRLELDELSSLRAPAILHWDLDHFVVLAHANRRHVTIHNPALGQRRYRLAEASRHFTGVAVELQPRAEFAPEIAARGLRLRDLWNATRGLGASLGHVLWLSLLLQVFALAAPFYVQLVVDEGIAKGDVPLVSLLALAFGVLLLLRVAVDSLRSSVLLHLGNLLGMQLAANLLHHLLRLPVAWFEKRQLGDVLSRFRSLQPINALFADGLVATAVDGVMAVTTLVLMLVYAPWLTVVVLAGVLLYVVVRGAVYPVLRRRTDESLQATAAEEGHVIESVRAVRTLKAFGMERDRHAQWQSRQVDVVSRQVSIGRLGIGYGAAQALFAGLENVLVVYLGARAVLDQQLTIGMLYAFIAYKTQFSDRATAVIDRLFDLRMLSVHLQRLDDIVGSTVEQPPQARVLLRPIEGTLALRGVSFAYAELEAPVFAAVDLEVPAGSAVAIVGPSGCGKSTLLSVLSSLLEPTSGELRVDGRRVDAALLPDYRARIGTVFQNDGLLAGSIADNISLFDPSPDYDQLRACAELACIDADIRALPMGYASHVGDFGAALSAGQRQRVLLARALYRRPAILLLDEITANLDPATAARVRASLTGLPMTRIYVTHDLELVRTAQRCYLPSAAGLQSVTMEQLARPATLSALLEATASEAG